MFNNRSRFTTCTLLLSAIVGIAAFAGPTAAHATTGPAWHARRGPLPADARNSNQNAGLASVSCPTASCRAVGRYATRNSYAGLIESRDSGSWSGMTAPAPSGQPSLGTVACSSGGECLAVGYAPYVDVFDGSWTAQTVSVPAGATGLEVIAAACWRTGCAGTGLYYDASDVTQWAMVTDVGGTWTATPVPLSVAQHNGFYVDPTAMSCRPDGTCEAVGLYGFRPGPGPEDIPTKPVLVTGSAAAGWTATVARLPANALHYHYAQSYPSDGLFAVSCPSGGPCIAVGKYTDDTYTQQGLIMDATTPVESPVPAGGKLALPADGLTRVTCQSGTACTIAGTYLTSSDAVEGLVLTGSVRTWSLSVAPLPMPANASTSNPNVVLTGLDCSSTTCAISGQYVDASEVVHAVLLTGGGASWQPVEAPAPAGGTQPSIAAVSCYDHGCVAVGSYGVPAHNNVEALTETLTG